MRNFDGIPREVRTSDEVLPVELKLRLGNLSSGGHEIGGLYLREEGRIVICSAMPRQAIANTLLHELGHWAFERAGLTLRYARSTEEIVVQGITSFLYDALQDKETARFITNL